MTLNPRIGRRTAFQGMAALGVALALAGCAGDDAPSTPTAEPGKVLATVDEVPVGGGLVLADEKLVITQPTAGEFRAFSSICTHQGAPLTVTGGALQCPLHGSVFSLEDGSVVQQPATQPLAEITLQVKGDEILAA